MQLHAEAILIDDDKGRRAAEALGLVARGTLAVLGLAWNAGVVGGSTLLVAALPADVRHRHESFGEVAMGLAAGHLLLFPGIPRGHDTMHHLWGVWAVAREASAGSTLSMTYFISGYFSASKKSGLLRCPSRFSFAVSMLATGTTTSPRAVATFVGSTWIVPLASPKRPCTRETRWRIEKPIVECTGSMA